MKNKVQQNFIKGFVIAGLLVLAWSCQNSSNNNKTATIVGTTLKEGDKFEMRYFTFQFAFNYGEFAIQKDGSFNGKITIPEPVFGEAKIMNDRRPVYPFPLYITPGATLKLTIGEKGVVYEGDLKKENEFLSNLRQEILKGFFKYFNSNDFSDLQKIDALRENSLAIVSNAQFEEEFKQFVEYWLTYTYQSLQYKIIAKADVEITDLPEEVLAFIKETGSEKFSSSAVMGTLDWRSFLDNYFKVQNKYLKSNSDELIERFAQIKNTFVKDRYALYLSNKLINSRDGMDGTCRKQVESLVSFVQNENTKTGMDSLLVQLSKSEAEYKHLLKGQPAPGFTFEDVNGNMVSLSDFKGKYVFLDVWNIFCGPCIQQIPYIKRYEEELKDKNIEFVAVTCDREEDKQKWRDFVVKNELVGHQLIMDKGRDSEFLMDYAIKGFPTFIIIDPDGNMVNYKFYYPERKEFLPALLGIIK